MQTNNKIPQEKIITLIGNEKYKDLFEYFSRIFSLAGKIVLTKQIFDTSLSFELSESEKIILKTTTRYKINMSDAIFVINLDDNLDKDTIEEIMYATIFDKKIYYYTDY